MCVSMSQYVLHTHDNFITVTNQIKESAETTVKSEIYLIENVEGISRNVEES